ncbi:hypothetical protein GQ53DRAFT_299506 [Thozetella sp. PMI_491]|nr:hypothetical protein GQ53DRAFT_299506 [Thozetella sp. PMI_491]
MESPTDGESRAGVTITVVAVMLFLATAAVGLRTYTRTLLIRQFGLDDCAAIVSMVLTWGAGVSIATNTMYGAGRHVSTLSSGMVTKYLQLFYVSIVLYNASLMAIKATFLIQYYRILAVRKMQKIVICSLVVVTLWSLSQLLVVVFTCWPVDKFWNQSLPGTCIPNLPFWYVNAAGSIVTDVTIFILPLPVLTALNLRGGQKLMLVGIFSLGFFTCAISIIRIQYLRLGDDVTWDNVDSSVWSITEICSGIICACLPTLRPLISRCIPGVSGRTSMAGYQQQFSGRGMTERSNPESRATSTAETAMGGGSTFYRQFYRDDLPELESDEPDQRSQSATLEQIRQHTQDLKRYQPGFSAVSRLHEANLGFKPTVRTEIKVGTPQPEPVEKRMAVRVKRDVTMINELHGTTLGMA